MKRLVGKSAGGGIAIGRMYVLKRCDISVRREKTDDIEAEIARLEAAKQTAVEELGVIYEKALKEVGEAGAQIFEIHMMLIEDEDLNEAVISMIRTSQVNAEYAVAAASDNLAEIFAAMEDGYMQARAADIRDVANRLIACLESKEHIQDMPEGSVIICADDLSPSETMLLDKNRILAFVTAHGSSNSHTAILARSMNIPAVIGIGEGFPDCVRDGEQAVVNGFTGEVLLSPDSGTLVAAQQRLNEEHEKQRLLRKLKGKDNITLCGRSIDIFANIGSTDSIGEVLLNDAGGIGLFRSEFIYMGRSSLPDEEEQFRIYKRVLESMAGRKVIIRTLDIGADKQADYLALGKEDNPALGLRAIRLCLTRTDIFRAQLKALFRASLYGRLGIMFPMIADVWELKEALRLCDEIRQELAADGIEVPKSTELGIMIETPAAAVISDRLAPLVDFFSVGTNDLTQYTLACDRQNALLERFCDPHHEAVLRLIELAAKNAHAHHKWIGICGELAADTSLTETFLRMGIDELSVSPSAVLRVRDVVRKIHL